ncbi:MAG TPA: hypothetical protein VK421_05990 [Pyrinomonadaceae bacterium]|nr:hypothetical protein [Pyrinomonadaceae bacterium]
MGQVINFQDEVARPLEKLNAALRDKIVAEIAEDDGGMDSMLIIRFADASALRIRYDWIYEFEITDPPPR